MAFGAGAARFAPPVRAFARAAGFADRRRLGALARFAAFFGAPRLAGLLGAARFAARARFAAGRRFGFDFDPLFFVAMFRLYIRGDGTGVKPLDFALARETDRLARDTQASRGGRLDEREAPDDPDPVLTDDEERLLDELGLAGAARRRFLGFSVAGGIGALAWRLLAHEEASAAGLAPVSTVLPAPAAAQGAVHVALKINGQPHALDLDPRTVLLDALRERLGLTGTKKGCDQGQCGACTVILDGRRVLSCLTLAATLEGREVTTIEGLAKGDALHPMQAAFIAHDAFQCGYCTPGQICSAVALLDEAKRGAVSHATEDVSAASVRLTDDEIRERMSGNICRCGAYPGIVGAIREVHGGKRAARTWRYAEPEELARIRARGKDDETV